MEWMNYELVKCIFANTVNNTTIRRRNFVVMLENNMLHQRSDLRKLIGTY